MSNHHRRESTPGSSSGSRDSPRPTLRIGGRVYVVLNQLSLPGRGRWQVRDPQPWPRGTLRTAIVLDDTPASRQLERSLWRLPQTVSGIPQLQACGSHEGKKVWIVSWIQGTVLENYLQNVHEGTRRRPSVSESIRRIQTLAHQLRIFQQDLGIVHGDIKPGNLVLPSPRGSIGLIDYGSSWQVGRTYARELGDGVGEGYAAPELLESRFPLDWRADQFSAGVVLYEMLTMELPYCGLGGKAGLDEDRVALEKDHRPPSDLVAAAEKIPRAILNQVDEIVGRLLQLDANRRFGTTSDFCQAMDALSHHLKGAQDSIRKHSHRFPSPDLADIPTPRTPHVRNLFKRLTDLMGGE